MLIPDVLAEVLLLFDRNYLTKLQLHGRGLRDIIDKVCPKYPLAGLHGIRIEVLPSGSVVVEIENANYRCIEIGALDFFDALRDVKVVMQKSYVDWFQLCAHSSLRPMKAPVTKRQWSALVATIQSATMERLTLKSLDLTDVETDQINQILGASCLEVVSLEWCPLPTASASDAFLAHCRDIGVRHLTIYGNDVAGGRSLSVSEEAVFDYCFRAGRRHGTSIFYLRLSMVQISDSFLRRFIETMEGSQSGRPYDFGFVGLNALPDLHEFRQYESRRSNTQVTFIIPFSRESRKPFHKLQCTCACALDY